MDWDDDPLLVSGIMMPMTRTPWRRGPVGGDDGPALISLTDFEAHSWRAMAGIYVGGLRFYRRWNKREGSIALTVWSRPQRKRVGSLSVWRSEEDLRRFLRSPEHVAIVRRFGRRMHNVGSTTWQAERFDPEEAWTEATRRLAA